MPLDPFPPNMRLGFFDNEGAKNAQGLNMGGQPRDVKRGADELFEAQQSAKAARLESVAVQVQIGNTVPFTLTFQRSGPGVTQSERDTAIEDTVEAFNLEMHARTHPPFARGYRQLQIRYGAPEPTQPPRAYVQGRPGVQGVQRYLHARPWTGDIADQYVETQGAPNELGYDDTDPSYSIMSTLFDPYRSRRYHP